MTEAALSQHSYGQEYAVIPDFRHRVVELPESSRRITAEKSEVERKVDALRVIDLGQAPAFIMQFSHEKFTNIDQVKTHIDAVVNGPRSQGVVTMLQDGGYSIAGYALNREQMDYLQQLAQEKDATLAFGGPAKGDRSRVTYDPNKEDPDICLLSSSIIAAARTLKTPGEIHRLDQEGGVAAKGDRTKRVDIEEVNFPDEGSVDLPSVLFESYDVDAIQEDNTHSAWVGQLDLNGSSEEYQRMLQKSSEVWGEEGQRVVNDRVRNQIGGFLQIKDKLAALGVLTADVAGDNFTYITENRADAELISQIIEVYYAEALPNKPLKNVMEEIRRTKIFRLGDRVVGLSKRLDHYKTMGPVERYHKHADDTRSEDPAIVQYREGHHGMTLNELQETLDDPFDESKDNLYGELRFKQKLEVGLRRILSKRDGKAK